MKFRQFKPSFYEAFERPSNAGLKPNFTPRSQVRVTGRGIKEMKEFL